MGSEADDSKHRKRGAADEAARTEAHERKQRWKELSGNRYTPEELKGMTSAFGPFTVHKRRTKVMYID